MGAGISVRNESAISILVIASQLSKQTFSLFPCLQSVSSLTVNLLAGCHKKLLCTGESAIQETRGMAKMRQKWARFIDTIPVLIFWYLLLFFRSSWQVWFTVSVGAYQAGAEPSTAGVALRLTAITAATLTGGVIGMGLVGGASGITSTMGVKRDGVYADCRCLVVRGVHHGDGCYELYFAVEERLDPKTGAVKSAKTLMAEPEVRSVPSNTRALDMKKSSIESWWFLVTIRAYNFYSTKIVTHPSSEKASYGGGAEFSPKKRVKSLRQLFKNLQNIRSFRVS